MENSTSFSEFLPLSKKEWKVKAIEDLKGADFDRKLVWKTYEGFNVQPYYSKEDLEGLDIERFQQCYSLTKNSWVNYQEIEEVNSGKANSIAKHAIEFGCEGILFHVDQNTDYSVLLAGIDPEKNHLSFTGGQPDIRIKAYFEYLDAQNIPLTSIRGFYDFDIIGFWATGDNPLDFKPLHSLIEQTRKAPHFYGLHIHSGDFVNAGANFTQELAFTLNKVVDYADRLTEAGLPIEEVMGNISLNVAITGDYFFEIAKLRALRNLLSGILGSYKLGDVKIPILSSNSVWSKSRYDHHVNLLRNTTEAMSAIIGGCDAVLIRPHDSTYEEPSAFSHRIATNISNLLREESYFDKVEDPAAGSYYLENLTRQLAEESLALFKDIEEKGGLIKCIEEGHIQNMVSEVKGAKEKDISTRKMVFVGTNKYPNPEEKIDLNLPEYPTTGSDGRPLLVPQRATRLFDELRQRTRTIEAKTGKTPSVYLAGFGNLTMRKARASFSADFFATAGFEVLGEFFEENVIENAKKSASSDADVVVMCSSDQDYMSSASQFVREFRSLDQQKKLVLAGFPAELIEQLRKEGVDEFIHIKTNAVETLRWFQDQILNKAKS